MTISFRGGGSNSTASSGSTLVATVSGGGFLGDATLIFVSCSIAGDVTSVSDNATFNGNGPGNIYTLIDFKTNGVYNLYCFFCPSSYQLTTVTAHFSTTGLTASVQALQYEVRASVDADGGSSWVVLDSHNEATGTTNPSTSVTTVAAITTIVAAAIGDNTSAPTNGTGFTTRESGTTTGLAFITEDKQETSANTYTASVNGAGLTTSTIIAVALTEPPAPYAVQSMAGGGGAAGNTLTSATWTLSQTAGNVNLVAVCWGDGTSVINSFSDTAGNSYSLLGSLQHSVSSSSVSLYVAYGILASSSNKFVVVFNVSVPSFAHIMAVECVPCFVDTLTVSFNAGSASSGTATAGPVTTSHNNEMLFALAWGQNETGTQGIGPLRIAVAGEFWGYEYIAAAGSTPNPGVVYSGGLGSGYVMFLCGVSFIPTSTTIPQLMMMSVGS